MIKQEKYLETGIHIGTKLKTIDMGRFIYRTRNDGLYVLDLRKIDERIKLVGKVLAKYEPSDIVVIASRAYSSQAARAFTQITGIKLASGRFIPGAFTNVARDDFSEPKLVFICDPKGERQAVIECGKMGIPTIGLCDTDNFTMFIDWVIPCNNKGRRSLALIFWLLARELAMSKGKISSYDSFEPTFEGFEAISSTPADGESAPAEEISEETETQKTASADDAPQASEAVLEGEKPKQAKKAKAKKSGKEDESSQQGVSTGQDLNEEKPSKKAAHAKKQAPESGGDETENPGENGQTKSDAD